MASEALRLFDDLPEARAAEKRATAPQGAARVLMANRLQMELRPSDLESLLPEGHRARMVWGYVEHQDLSAMYAAIKARQGSAGRESMALEVLFALWLYATLQGVGSARGLARRGRNAKHRSAIIPSPPVNATHTAEVHPNTDHHSAPAPISWARLLKRVFVSILSTAPTAAAP